MTTTDPNPSPVPRVFTLGAHARCEDGIAGTVTRVVVDPRTRTVTHLVVVPHRHTGFGRLVPLDRVGPATDDTGDVVLACTRAELATFDEAEEHRFIPAVGVYGAYGPDLVLCWPYYSGGLLGGVGMGGGVGGAPVMISSETVPLGEVSVHRGDAVHTTDGTVGHLHGLVVDPDDGVSHLLLQEGHLWGRKRVAIPIGAVVSMDDGVVVRLSTRQVHDLPEVALHPPVAQG